MLKVSIITPSFNSERYIEETIHSVAAQTYRNIEHIVIDGCSSDNSLQIISKYSNLRVVSQPDKSMYEAINKGIDMARGDVIAYLNSDDLYYNNTVEKAVDYFSKNSEIDFIFGGLDLIDHDSKFIARYEYPDFNLKIFASVRWSLIPQQASFWLRSVHNKVGKFNPDFKLAGDYEFFLRVAKKCHVKHVKGIYARQRIHKGSLTLKYADQNKKELILIREQFHPDIIGIENSVVQKLTRVYLRLRNIQPFFHKVIYKLKQLKKC